MATNPLAARAGALLALTDGGGAVLRRRGDQGDDGRTVGVLQLFTYEKQTDRPEFSAPLCSSLSRPESIPDSDQLHSRRITRWAAIWLLAQIAYGSTD